MNTAHALSPADRRFRADFEVGRIAPADVDHPAHLRLAYIFLVEFGPDEASARFKTALLDFIAHHGIDAAKYHETMTQAWMQAVQYFMNRSPPASSAAAFVAANPALLDRRIMLTHYSTGRLFSDDARREFVEPDLDPIPRATD